MPEERKFVGFDAYQKAIDAGCDLVILATPPGFRPIHFEAAVKAGKHVFMEKPVATDAPGVRQVLAAAEEAKKKNLGGRRRPAAPPSEQATSKRSSGSRTAPSATSSPPASTGTAPTPWVRTRAKLNDEYKHTLTEMEYQMRNWYYFTWICGDHIVEQHIHNLDVINWLKNGHPVKANGMGGCEVRKGKDYGEIFDHHCVEFEYADGTQDVQPVPAHRRLLEQRLGARAWHQRHVRHRRVPHQVERRRSLASSAVAATRNPYQVRARRSVRQHRGRQADQRGRMRRA